MTMTTATNNLGHVYTINTECGLMADFEAANIDEAKEVYRRKYGYDFDRYQDYPGSWYYIVEDDETVEDHSENMPQ